MVFGPVAAAIVVAGAVRADWAFQGLGWDEPEGRAAWVARFAWQGEGADLDSFAFRDACEEVAAFLAGSGRCAGRCLGQRRAGSSSWPRRARATGCA